VLAQHFALRNSRQRITLLQLLLLLYNADGGCLKLKFHGTIFRAASS